MKYDAHFNTNAQFQFFLGSHAERNAKLTKRSLKVFLWTNLNFI